MKMKVKKSENESESCGIIIGGSDKFSVDPKLKVKVIGSMKVKVAVSSSVAMISFLLIQN